MCFAPWRAFGVQSAALASLLFDRPKPQNIGKHSVSRFLYFFTHLDLLSTDSVSSDISDSFSAVFFSSLTALTTVAAAAHKSEV